jgi:hypothetical protein
MWLHWQALRGRSGTQVSKSVDEKKKEQTFDDDVVVEHTSDAFKCPICLSTLRAPMIGQCGHAVCEACLFQLVGIGSERSRVWTDSRCVVCRQMTPWYSPCHALNSALSPDAVYTKSSGAVITDREMMDNLLSIGVKVNVYIEERPPKGICDRCRRWFDAPLQEWLLRLALLSACPGFYLATGWIYYVMATFSLLFALAWVIKELKTYGLNSFHMDAFALISTGVVVGVCSIAHFLTTAGFWLFPSAAVVGFFYSKTILRKL